MPEMTQYAPGTPSWADLLARDGQAAKDFYTALFGWTYDDHPAGPDMVYTMFSHNGMPACASAEAGPGQENLPPHWSVYVTVDDLEAAVERAQAAGGTVVFGPMDVTPTPDNTVGRMAVIQDREGAFLRLWYPVAHTGAGVMMEPGALCWFELATTDPESAKDFYQQTLGVEINLDENMDEFSYWLMTVDDQMVGGMVQIGEDWGPVPPNWGVYFGVNDVEITVAKAQELGGSLVHGPADIADFARFAVLGDAEGAIFTVIKLNDWE
ncbi:MAG: VOC family protein [Chloroflexi bacterium]|nr:VOC family protein [Chloroflexota bacterium]MYD47114.1 VOC family protein [Chloroflexota bacterium]